MELRITTTPALLGLNRTPGKLDMQQPKADQEIHTEQAKVKIQSTQPKILIDQTQCFSESGLKPISDFSRENAQYGISKMYDSVARISEQGTELSNIQDPSNKFAEQGLYNAYDQFQVDYNMVTMPRSKPNITVIEGKTDITVEGGTVNHNVKVNKPIVDFKPGKVEIYIRQMNSINIEAVPSKLDKKV